MRAVTAFFTAAFALAVTAASAADYKAGSLDISDPWSRATPKGASVAAGYMTIKNNGSTPDRLVEGSSDVASKFEVHEMKMEGSVAGSLHIMFVGLKKPLSAGDHFKATLVFEKAGPVSVDYDVRAMGSERGGSMPGMKGH
jgi:periplasmic copper chaperone A